MSRQADIAAALSYLDPDVHVEDTSEPDGACITVETGGQAYPLLDPQALVAAAPLPANRPRHLNCACALPW
jgi:hypothetical protein